MVILYMWSNIPFYFKSKQTCNVCLISHKWATELAQNSVSSCISQKRIQLIHRTFLLSEEYKEVSQTMTTPASPLPTELRASAAASRRMGREAGVGGWDTGQEGNTLVPQN